MRNVLEEKLRQLIEADCRRENISPIWKKPIIRFADARDPGFLKLREAVDAGHHLPQDYLPGAKNVLSWFLPFLPELGRNNLPGKLSSEQWANAYLVTNEMAGRVNGELVSYIQNELGCAAAVPVDAGMISENNPRSRWSQRHVAYLAGHGTFGKNNMLISDVGTVGRYFSIVTALDISPDDIIREERCLWKQNGTCGACIRRCESGALTDDGFDRFKCLQQCLKNMARYPGADVCGKCIVELPCSYGIPKTRTKE